MRSIIDPLGSQMDGEHWHNRVMDCLSVRVIDATNTISHKTKGSIKV